MRLRNVVPRNVMGERSRLTMPVNASVASVARTRPDFVAHDTPTGTPMSSHNPTRDATRHRGSRSCCRSLTG